MRLLLTTDPIGGVWTFTKDLCEGLLARGHAIALVSVGRMPSAAQMLWCRKTREVAGQRFRFNALTTPLEWMEANECAYRGAEAALLGIAEEFRAEVIHANQFCFGALPVHAAKVVTAHSDVMSWAEACRPEGLGNSEWLRRYCSLVEEGLRGADAVVTPTQWMANALGRGFSTGEVRTILNGRTIPCPAFAGERRVLQAVSVGRLWDEAKGFAVLDELNAAMPVIVAGETTLEGAAGADVLSEDEVIELFRRSSVYVATSVYEPFGLAPLEAALCGCAVVANGIDSLREVWGDAAIYFDGAAELKTVLNGLASSPERLRGAQLRSMERGLELSAEKVVDGYVALYAELIEARDGAVCDEAEAYAG
jgi:glycosyltransferase involved in cell wall biosynthesis